MKKVVISLSTLCMLCMLALLLSGCANTAMSRQDISDSRALNAPPSVPALPPELRLGNAYISGLGEHCYEVFSTTGQESGARATCWREGDWKLQPPIYMTVQNTAPGVPRQ